MKTRAWLFLFAGILSISILAILLFPQLRLNGNLVEIYQNGTLLQKIDLQTVTAPYSFEISNEHGTNTILVAPNQISVADATCPDRLCVKQGPIQRTGYPIVCLPHRLVIRLRSDSPQTPDGISH